jgi:hypothetical protein
MPLQIRRRQLFLKADKIRNCASVGHRDNVPLALSVNTPTASFSSNGTGSDDERTRPGVPWSERLHIRIPDLHHTLHPFIHSSRCCLSARLAPSASPQSTVRLCLLRFHDDYDLIGIFLTSGIGTGSHSSQRRACSSILPPFSPRHGHFCPRPKWCTEAGRRSPEVQVLGAQVFHPPSEPV